MIIKLKEVGRCDCTFFQHENGEVSLITRCGGQQDTSELTESQKIELEKAVSSIQDYAWTTFSLPF